MSVRLQLKFKSNSRTESCRVNVVDVWREGMCDYPRMSVWNAPKGVIIMEGNTEHTEVSRDHSSQKTRAESI